MQNDTAKLSILAIINTCQSGINNTHLKFDILQWFIPDVHSFIPTNIMRVIRPSAKEE